METGCSCPTGKFEKDNDPLCHDCPAICKSCTETKCLSCHDKNRLPDTCLCPERYFEHDG